MNGMSRSRYTCTWTVAIISLAVIAVSTSLYADSATGLKNIARISVTRAGSQGAKERPTIGIALSGGGGRGLALIGALKVIEELRIPVDYIAGTSMGSIVAALYASGLSPDEIEKAMLDMDWEDLFSDQRKRSERVFRRKQDDGAEFFNFELGIHRFKPVAAAGLVAGQKMTLAINVPFIHTTSSQNFDDLKIPYRAVATDLETGEMVVLSSGSLVHAVRASMSIPGVFAPVHLDGKYLVDGGLVRNLPVDVVKEMGADIVIAFDVGSPVDELDETTIRSLSDVTQQSFNIFLRSTSKDVLDLADVYIPLKLEGISTADFKLASKIIRMGEETAREQARPLSEYSAGEKEYERFVAGQRHGEAPVIELAEVRIDNRSRVSSSEIRRRLTVKPGDVFDQEMLNEDFKKLYELGIFESVDYRLMDEQEGVVLLIEIREKFYAPNILNLGFDYIDDLEGRSDFGILARYTRLEMNRRGGEFRLNLRLGLSRGIETEYYQPIDPSRFFFIAPALEAVTMTEDIFDEDHRIAEYQTRYVGFGIDAGLQLGKFAEVRFGVEQRRMNTVVGVGTASLPEEWKTRSAMKAAVTTDFLDCPDFPTSGGSASIRFYAARKQYGGEEEYERLSFDGAHFLSFGGLTLFGTISGGTDLGSELPFDERFRFGGPHSFSGLKEGQLSGGAFGVARAGFYVPFIEGKVLVGPTFYFGGTIEGGNVWEGSGDYSLDDLRFAGSFFLGLKTILGPMVIGYGRTDDRDDSFYLTAGRQFGSY